MPERSAIVTGAAGGIGRAVAQRLTDDGWGVLAADLKPAGDGPGVPYAADLTTREGNRGAVDAALEAFGRLDAVIPNAGFQHVAPIEEFDPESFRTIHALMLHAPFLLARSVLPGMYDRGWGRLVHVSSVHGHRASAYKSAYVSAKHGLEGLSKVIALEAADKGVTSNTVCPGYVRTPLVEGQLADQARTHGIAEDDVLETVLLARTPVKRLVEPEEVAEAVAFLCGPAAASMTGSSLMLDGGWTAA
jgi:3-hydroxybutyrate dehydrogenase